jgi:ArsR family transcriptional regulator
MEESRPGRGWCCVPLGEGRLGAEEARDLERVLRVVADRHRLRIIDLLAGHGDAICVCDFVGPLGLSQPTVSHHLKRLADAGLVERERRGSYAYYRLAPGALERLGALLPAAPVTA